MVETVQMVQRRSDSNALGRLRLSALILPAVFLLLPIAAAAQGIQATIDRTQAAAGDELRLSIAVEGGGGARPQLPQMPDFQYASIGQSQRFVMGSGGTRRTIIYEYLLIPRRAGRLSIPPVTVIIDGRTYRSQPILVNVAETGQEAAESQDIYVRAYVSERRPYVGQQILFTWRLYRRVQIANAQLGNFELDGFTFEDLGDTRTYDQVVNGRTFRVHEIRRALFPQEAGTLTIPAVELKCDVLVAAERRRRRSAFEDFFSRPRTQTRRLLTPPIEVEARPLPTAPPNFSGLVGDFDLSAKLSKQQLKVGESATLEVTIRGKGNVQQIGQPPVPDIAAFKLYPDKPRTRLNRSGNTLSGSRTFPTALVPLQPGEQTLPPLELVYFDPEAGSFRTAATPPLRLTVAPGDGQEDLGLTVALTPGGGKGAVRILSEDILPIHRRLEAVTSRPLRPAPLWFLGLFLPPGLYLALRHTLGQRRRYRQDHRLLRRRDALKNGLREVAGLRRDGGDPRRDTEQASRALRGYIGDKLGVEGTALTPDETARLLHENGLEEEAVQPVRRLLEQLEAAQYSASGAVARPEELPGQLEDLLKSLDRQLGRTPPHSPSQFAGKGGRGASLSSLLFILLLPLLFSSGASAQPPSEARTLDDPEEVTLSLPGSGGSSDDEEESGEMTGSLKPEAEVDDEGAIPVNAAETGDAGPSVDFDPAETFVTANTAYESGDYLRAATLYQRLIEAGHDSADLHFNLGNAYLRLGQLGPAIAAYRRAESRAPRDEDIAANLGFARGTTTDALEPPGPPKVLATLFFWHYGLSRSELALGVLILNLLFWGLLVARLWRPASEALRWVVPAVLVLLLTLTASLTLRHLSPIRIAVITPLEVEAHSGPGVDDQVLFKLHTGAEIRLLEERPDWLRIALPEGAQGWITADQAEVVRW